MANTFVVSRNHLIFGLCLPVAVLVGYLLADPLESSSLAVVVMILSVLLVPLLMRWHHPLLILTWNAMINPTFLPGRPYLWMLIAFVSLLFAALGRAVNAERKFLNVPTLTWPVLSFLAVVLVTAKLTGGFGVRSLGAERFGGKGYFYILAAVAGYFALTGQRIPRQHARLYVAMFFLSGLTAMISNLAYKAGPQFYFLFDWLPPEIAYEQAAAEYSLGDNPIRMSGLMIGGMGISAFLLANYGIAGVFDFSRPWRLALFLGAGFATMFGGFRSAVLFQLATFMILFMVEGLWRTRYVLYLLGIALLGGVAIVSTAEKLPLAVQRAVSFLPIKVDALTKQAAEASVEWRLELWRNVLPDVPRYLFKGKGYSLDPNELYMGVTVAAGGSTQAAAAAAIAGDYHNGPLSVVIPFGIYGTVTFVWFLAAGAWVLRQNLRYGDPAFHTINAFLLACFITRVIFFIFVFGALYHELFNFTGLVGLSVSLNGGLRRPDSVVEPTPD